MKASLAAAAVAAVAVALMLTGCDDMSGTGDEPAALPHHGTWYFADPDPDDDVPVPPGARLVLAETEFTLAMGDGMDTPFPLFQTPGVTRFEVSGTYTIGVEGASFDLPDDLASDVIVKPDSVQEMIAARVVAAAAALQEDATATIMVDPTDLNRVTISGDFLPGLLSLPDVTEVTACKGAPCVLVAGGQ